MGEAEKELAGPSGVNAYAAAVDEAEGLDKIEDLQNHANEEIYDKAANILEAFFVRLAPLSRLPLTLSLPLSDSKRERTSFERACADPGNCMPLPYPVFKPSTHRRQFQPGSRPFESILVVLVLMMLLFCKRRALSSTQHEASFQSLWDLELFRMWRMARWRTWHLPSTRIRAPTPLEPPSPPPAPPRGASPRAASTSAPP